MKQNENIDDLFGIPKDRDSFRVPAGYFENFDDRLKARIEAEKETRKSNSILLYLKPALTMAASIALVMLLVYVPINKFFPSDKGYAAREQLLNDTIDPNKPITVPIDLINAMSDAQFWTAAAEINEIEEDTLSNESLGKYIAVSCNDYEIIACN